MKKKTTLKWFTLIEMLIVIVIVWILAVVLTESYITISRTALKIEQEKNISEESLVLTQIFQSIADEATIDYDKYDHSLDASDWFTGVLYLTGWQWTWTSIYSSWENCLDLHTDFPENENISERIRKALTWCELILQQGEETISLVSNWKVIVSRVMFKIIPYDSDANYFSGAIYGSALDENQWFVIDSVHQQGFWAFIHLYAPLYQPTWTNKIDLPLQLFFNLKL